MILEKETYEKFGYYPDKWKRNSGKRVIAKCNKCGKIREVRKGDANLLCPSCAARLRKQRYPQLFNYDWIFQKYIIEKKTTLEIAKLLGCERTAVGNSLKRFNIPVQRKNRNIKHSKLEDKEWVVRRYWTEMKTTMEIAKILGCDDNTVRRAVKRLNIPERQDIRNMRRASEKTKQKMRKARKHRRFPTHHTKPELIFEKICKKHNLPFRYVGDGSLWIGKEKALNPDFCELNGNKTVIEIMGDYWHSPLLNRNLRESAILQYRKRHYRKYKWQSIFLWESDLKRSDAEDFVLCELKKGGAI